MTSGDLVEALAHLADQPLRRRNVADEVVDRLQRLILDGRFAPGERLPPQRQLAEALGVGLSSVREAISALVGAHLLEVRPGSGTFVTPLAGSAVAFPSAGHAASTRLRDLVEVRRALEGIAVRGFVARAGEEDVEALRAAMTAMRATSGDADLLARRDAELHMAIARGSRNSPALAALQSLGPLLETELRHNVDLATSSVGDLEFAIRSHELLVDALAAGDADKAMTQLEDVLRRAAFYADAGAGRDRRDEPSLSANGDAVSAAAPSTP